jgi:hypothetical protein
MIICGGKQPKLREGPSPVPFRLLHTSHEAPGDGPRYTAHAQIVVDRFTGSPRYS